MKNIDQKMRARDVKAIMDCIDGMVIPFSGEYWIGISSGLSLAPKSRKTASM